MSDNRTTKWIAGFTQMGKAHVAEISGLEREKHFQADKIQADKHADKLFGYRIRVPKDILSDTRDEAVQRACTKMLEKMKLLDAEKLQLDQTYWAMKSLLDYVST